LIVFAALAGLLGSWQFVTPSEGAIILASLPAFAAAVIFGPCAGALTFGVGCLVGEVLRRKAPVKVAFNSAQLALAGGLAGLAFSSLKSGSSLTITSNVLAYSVATAAYFIVNSALAGGAIALTGQSPMRPVVHALRNGGVFYLAMVPLSALLAEAYAQSSWNLLYFPVVAWLLAQGFKLHAQLRDQTGQALNKLADTIDRRDPYTYQHSLRVAAHVSRIVTNMGLKGEEAELIVAAAHVHDLGKIAIDNRTLFKEGRLTDEEWEQIKLHPEAGAELAAQFSLFDKGAKIIRHHHERWNGSGYPDGLVGESIPLGARMIAVADVYDAMTSDRPYRRALPHEVAAAELLQGSGILYDPQVVLAFLEVSTELLPTVGATGVPVRLPC
jgi:putative nucleotidyltransferase with HDIG domain